MTITFAEQRTGYGPPSPAPIFQWEAEFEQLLAIYRQRAPKRVLEVGTYHGGTLYHWLQNAKPGTTIVSVDSYAVGIDNRASYLDWIPEGVELVVLEGDSHDPATAEKVAQHGPFDWTFIDAGHYYHEVQRDWELYRPLTEGVVVFHDILPATVAHPEIEVARLWSEIKQSYRTEEIIADPGAEWGGIGLCYVGDELL